MPSLAARTLAGVGLALATTGSVSAQTSPFTACRVPGVNVIYMIDFGSGSPTACLDPAHVQFTWTEGGAPGPGSVTTAMLADGAVTTAKLAASVTFPLADGSITTVKLANGS